MTLDGYEALEVLHEGARTVTLRARRVGDARGVVLKRLRAPFPSVWELAHLQREHDLARAAAGPGVIAVHGFYAREGAAWIELEDFRGASLERRFAGAPPPVAEALDIALALLAALESVHRAGVVHKDVCPANVLLADDGPAVRLIDFGAASATPRQAPLRADRLEGTPAYMSPEQTGRMNRPLDHRSDYYAFGATLYFLLTGEAPFPAGDPLELVHAHIARVPPMAHARAPGVPEALSRVVAALLAKRAEARYQSAAGIRHDLTRCRDGLRAPGGLAPFPLRAPDHGGVLRVPDTLYGRGDDIAALDDAVARAALGASDAIGVTGAGGVGKTSLVGELRRAAAAHRATFVQGKFEQFQRDVPYGPVLLGLRAALQALLGLDAASLARWRARIVGALGEAGAALAEALPELELLVGPLRAPGDLPPDEAERRFQHALLALLAALPDGPRPAVVFLDDLQWVDAASASLLEALLIAPQRHGVLVVGAWRDAEVDEGHLLARALRRAAGFGARLTRLCLEPLGPPDVRALLVDTLARDDAEVDELARLALAWTGGNPFLLHRFVEGIHEVGLLRWEGERWRWDAAEVARRGLGADAAGYVAGRIAELPEGTRRCLEAASCFAGTFHEADLGAVLGRTAREVRGDLAPALALRLVYPAADDWWPGAADGIDFGWAFAHDRIQEAARARLDEAGARAVHLRIGERLRDRGDADPFDVVHHLNHGVALMGDAARAELGERNAEAGRRALRSGAFGVAHDLLERAVELLPADAWGRAREAARALTLDAARAASLVGAAARVDAHVDAALARAETALERCEAFEIRARDRAGRDVLGAIDVALDAMALLGVALPRRPAPGDVERAIGAAVGAITARGADAIVALPELDDPAAAAVIRLADAVVAPAYLAAPLLLPVLAAEVVAQSLARGMTPKATYGYAVTALVLAASGALGPAHDVARLCLRLMERFDDRGVDARSAHVVWGFVMPLTVPLREAVAAHRAFLPRAMAAGDHEYATWIAHLSLANAFYAGAPLAPLEDDLAREARTMLRLEQRVPLACTDPFLRHVRALRGETAGLGSMDEGDYDEAAAAAALAAEGARGPHFLLQTQRMMLRYLFRDLAGALALADAAEGYADGAAASYHVVAFHQTAALASAGLAAGDPSSREALVARARRHRAHLAGLAAHAPHNHAHRVALIDAELARAEGDVLAAIDGYDDAARAAREGGFAQDGALANELAGRLHLARGRHTAARAYLAEASAAWARWGATGKLAHLAAELPGFVAAGAGAAASTVRLDDAELDLATLSKATLAITSEMRTDRLVERVLEVSAENAGATRALLLLERDGALRLEASRGALSAARGAGLDALPEVPVSVVQYAARTGEPLVLGDARLDPRFAEDPALQGGGARSVLAQPLLRKGRVAGVIYLENDLAAEVFTPARCRLQALLGAQAVTSLENAQLYEEAESLARAAARFVPTEFLAQLGRRGLAEVAPGDAAAHEMTILFTDLRGFTGLTERQGPAATFELLNAWLSRVAEVVARRGGFVHDIVGDATLALFSGPPDEALRAAVEFAAIPRALVAEGVTRVELRAGIGVNWGPVTLGTLGSERRLAISVVGDAVNTAARMETATKGVGAQALVSQALVDRLREPGAFALRPLGRVALHGRASPVELCELLDVHPPALREALRATLTAFRDGLAALRGGDHEGAARRFEACVAQCPDDAVAAGLLERIRRGHGAGGKDDLEIL